MSAANTCRVYTADRIFDGQHILHNHAVFIRDNTIYDVLPVNTVQRHPGCTIVPGLIDAHMHFMRWQGPLFLAFGVTTVRDTGNDLQWILHCRNGWRQNAWPRIICLGPLIGGTPLAIH